MRVDLSRRNENASCARVVRPCPIVDAFDSSSAWGCHESRQLTEIKYFLSIGTIYAECVPNATHRPYM
jgi:hypothetical protein